VNEQDTSTRTETRKAAGWRRWPARAAAAILALVAMGMSVVGVAGCGDAGGEENSEAPAAAERLSVYARLPQKGIALGALSAPVELFELSDLQCPFCRDFTRDTLPVLVERYVRPGHLRVIFHNLPILGADSERAARVAVATGLQGHMFEFIDVFFQNQAHEGSGYVTEDFLRRIAGAVPGVDVERALRDADGGAVADRLDQAHRVAREFGIRSTPSFIVGRTGEELKALPHYRVSDPAPFIAAIDALLAAH
jgi:protein-disulfide isomerase